MSDYDSEWNFKILFSIEWRFLYTKHGLIHLQASAIFYHQPNVSDSVTQLRDGNDVVTLYSNDHLTHETRSAILLSHALVMIVYAAMHANDGNDKHVDVLFSIWVLFVIYLFFCCCCCCCCSFSFRFHRNAKNVCTNRYDNDMWDFTLFALQCLAWRWSLKCTFFHMKMHAFINMVFTLISKRTACE